MKPTISLDQAGLNRALGRFVAETGRSMAAAVKEQAKAFVRDLIGGTPPFGKHPFTRSTNANTTGESYNEQRRIGERAVRRDVRRVFKDVAVLARWMARKFKDPELGARVLRYAKLSDTQAIQTILNAMNLRGSVQVMATRKDHASRRNRRGRVSPRGLRFFITDGKSVDDYEKEQVSHVGKAKGGWASAAAALGVPVPAWIRRNAGPGIADVSQLANLKKPSVTIGNLVAHAQSMPREVIEAVVENRIRAMRIRAEAIVKAEYEKERRRGR